MVEEKAAYCGEEGTKCLAEQVYADIGDVGVGIFKKLMSALVDSTMLYGVEI